MAEGPGEIKSKQASNSYDIIKSRSKRQEGFTRKLSVKQFLPQPKN